MPDELYGDFEDLETGEKHETQAEEEDETEDKTEAQEEQGKL